MLRKVRLDPSNADLDGLGNDLTGVGPWLAAQLVATAIPDGLAHQLSLQSSANLSGITITIVGTDADDKVITEARAGPNNNTVETTLYFKTVTSIAAGATLGANTMDVGWVDEFVSPTYYLDFGKPVKIDFVVTGTISLDVDFCRGPAGSEPQHLSDWVVASSSLDDETAAPAAPVEVAWFYSAFRFRINSYTDTAEVTFYAVQDE